MGKGGIGAALGRASFLGWSGHKRGPPKKKDLDKGIIEYMFYFVKRNWMKLDRDLALGIDALLSEIEKRMMENEGIR